MHRSYHMRHSKDPIGPIVDVDYTPIQIIVRMMSGASHTLFTDNDNETFLAVKRALRPHLSPEPVLEQLVFQHGNQEIGYENVDDSATILSLTPQVSRIIELQLLLREREWTAEQQRIIDQTSKKCVWISITDIFNHGHLEAYRWGLQNNSSILSLKIGNIYGKDTDRDIRELAMATIMDVIRQSTSIQRLEISSDGFFTNDMATFFDTIGQNNSLVGLNIAFSSFRLNDLTHLLSRNTSIRWIRLYHCRIEVENDNDITRNDITRFGEVLAYQPTLKYLTLINNNIYHTMFDEVGSGFQTWQLHDIFYSLGARDNYTIHAKSTSRISLDWGEKPDEW